MQVEVTTLPIPSERRLSATVVQRYKRGVFKNLRVDGDSVMFRPRRVRWEATPEGDVRWIEAVELVNGSIHNVRPDNGISSIEDEYKVWMRRKAWGATNWVFAV